MIFSPFSLLANIMPKSNISHCHYILKQYTQIFLRFGDEFQKLQMVKCIDLSPTDIRDHKLSNIPEEKQRKHFVGLASFFFH